MSQAPVSVALDAVLLDTCAAIWLANGSPLSREAMAAIIYSGLHGRVFVSPASAWEIGMLSNPRPGRTAVQFLPDPKTWFTRFLAGAGIRQAELTPEIAIDASFLPGEVHGDPGDRLIIATARHLGIPVITRDRKIIAYAETGGVAVIVC